MAAFIPSRRDPEINARALGRVREDKEREAGDGFDGTWVAHPDLVAVARGVFDRVLGDRTHHKERKCEDVNVAETALLDVRVEGGEVTEPGLRTNVGVAIQYLWSWLRGVGAVGLMEDAATAKISRTQLWQWIRHGVSLSNRGTVRAELYRKVREDELAPLLASADAARAGRMQQHCWTSSSSADSRSS